MRTKANMKYIALTGALSIAIAVGSAVSSLAEQSGGDGKRPSFETLDANGDGQLTRAELDAHMKAGFDRRDTDGDGVLSRSELEAQAHKNASNRLDRRIGRIDADGDGAISFEEMSEARGGRLFERADTDNDGAINKAEFDEMRMQARANRQGRLQ